jgi:hypothetical protein
MIAGFNTEVSHGGQVYHVQSEDRGKDNPILESLVYIGGTVVAKKLTPYSDRLNDGAGDETIASLLKRQHQVIIAAIKAGRIEELVRHSRKQQAGPAGSLAKPARNATPNPEASIISRAREVGKPRGATGSLNLDKVIAEYVQRASEQVRLDLKVLTPEVFIAGSNVGLRVRVSREHQGELDATVKVKIIGTAFKPQVYIGRAGRDGVASFSLALPNFNAGTAAIVIEAQSGAARGELKTLIRRA